MEPRFIKSERDEYWNSQLTSWERERIGGELLPLEPVPEYRVGWREFVALAVMIVGVVVWAVSK